MKIVVFGGTTEGRLLSRELAGRGAEVTVCVASDYGEETQGTGPGIRVRTGRLSRTEKLALLQGAALCVDATHPYAGHISASLREACAESGTPYRRLLRPESETGNARQFDTAEQAAGWLAGREGNILLATGAKELEAFRALPPERIFPRILPNRQSLEVCEKLGIPHRNIIAMQGPFTREMNIATIRQYQIRYLVTKDGGGPGGFPEKAEAARETGAECLVLRRPRESGLSFDEILNECIRTLSGEERLRYKYITETEGEQT